VDTESGLIVLGSQMKTIDVFGETFTAERPNGQIGIFQFPNSLVNAVTLQGVPSAS